MTKQELHAALDIHTKIQRLRARLSDLEYVNCKAPEVRVQGGCAVSVGQIAAELSGEITELEGKLKIEQVVIQRHLDKCPLDDTARKLMALRYVECRPFKLIKVSLGYEDAQMYRIHNAAKNMIVDDSQ